MKTISKIFVIMIIFFFINGVKIFSQNNERPLLITSFNMVSLSDMGKVNKMLDSVFAPILNKLVDDGFLISWGQFTHLWGDEWNFNFYYIAKDLESFDKFWNEYVTRVSKKFPDAFPNTAKYFQAHKDNIYTLRTRYPSLQN
ncbi:MAG: hypothetical protein N3D80_03910 [Ignavibacterium album]|uniref:hypothetical protein n=1 Tax=Ignavibacterium album TaxID=591197 RepID=UPI0026EEE4CF|nr:hypothetical protein [Ignavibacterium album]MCX8105003.1 hypothetical protein [Ignavibacterium album]